MIYFNYMRKLILLIVILLASCSTQKKIGTPNYDVPKNFDEAEKWFDEWHKR